MWFGRGFPPEAGTSAHVRSTLQGLDECATFAAVGCGGNERHSLAIAKGPRVVAVPANFPRWRLRHYARLQTDADIKRLVAGEEVFALAAATGAP
jgi:hypothetical protein